MRYRSLLIFIALCFSSIACLAGTLDEVKKRGYLKCGVSQSLPGFSYLEGNGTWTGLDVDICRAIATGIFADAKKVKFTPLSAKERFTALQTGEIDVLSRNTTWTFLRDTSLGIEFTNVTYYDAQGFMVRKSSGITDPRKLAGASICTNTGTTTELNVADYFNSNKMPYNIVTFEKAHEVLAAYDTGRCDVYTSDLSAIQTQRRMQLTKPEDHIVLKTTISKEPLAVAVRQNDSQWADVVRWIIYGIVNADEYNITSSNIKKFMRTNNSEIKRLLGINSSFGSKLKLNNDFMVPVIKQVGNYGEIFDRNFGKKSKLKMQRGLNDTWSKGGLMYAPPFR